MQLFFLGLLYSLACISIGFLQPAAGAHRSFSEYLTPRDFIAMAVGGNSHVEQQHLLWPSVPPSNYFCEPINGHPLE